MQLRLKHGTRKARVKERKGGTGDLPESQSTVVCGVSSREQFCLRQGGTTRRWAMKCV